MTVIQVVNPNTSRAMTDGIARSAREAAGAGTVIRAVTPDMGPASIESHYEHALSVPGVLAAVAAGERDGVDGHVIACFGDPGLDAAREIARGPVVGIAEAAMHVAGFLGRSFSVVTTLSRTAGHTRDLARDYGFGPACAGVHGCGLPVLGLDEPGARETVLKACAGVRDADGCDVIVLGCAGMGGLARDLSAELGLPVVDGVAAAVKLAESLVALGLRTSKRDEYAPPPPKPFAGPLAEFTRPGLFAGARADPAAIIAVMGFEELVAEAAAVDVSGWDFSWLDGRATEERPPWGYQRLMGERIGRASVSLDIQTGGGEVLAGVEQRAAKSMVATESWPPNLAIAQRNLRAKGVVVVADADDPPLPFADGAFDLVTSRHPVKPHWNEIARVLAPGGAYFSQQVGPELTGREVREFFLGPQPPDPAADGRDLVRAAVEGAGLEVADLRTAAPKMEFFDVGAMVYFLRKVIWFVPDFTVDKYRDRLRDLHDRIQADGPFVSYSRRFLIEARKPA